jgi:tetratricopeptide (TPR) repeat protein
MAVGCGRSRFAIWLVASSLAGAAAAQLPSMPAGASPAEQQIGAARAAIAAAPGDPEAHVALALALARRARETADSALYADGHAAIDQALAIDPGHYEAEKIRVWLLLGQHDFASALERAKALNKRMPDDVLVYGFLVDAHAELGQYQEAEEAAQWMLDLRQGNIPGLTRAAYLREMFGDVEGAIELMDAAFHRTRPTETEDRAWLLVQLAHLKRMSGALADAETLARQALDLFPGYHYALGELGRVKVAERKHDEAVGWFRRHYAAAPHPENLFTLGEALALSGQTAEASRTFAEFEAAALEESDGVDNANRELVAYYVDHASMPADALRIATLELARRRDVYTLDAYAWALRANGRHAEARQIMEEALAVGIRDPRILYHAGAIAAAQRDVASATKYLDAALQQAPQSSVSEAARALRETLKAQ